MNYEKKYKEIVGKIRKAYLYAQANSTKAVLEGILPELKENEDERIKKAILSELKYLETELGWDTFGDGVDILDAYAWLEKQGEQKSLIEMKSPEESLGISAKEYNEVVNGSLYGESKSADKVEPKFKVGDYVVGKYISGYITGVRDDCYLLDYQGFPIDKQDHYHLWTIQDAKDGDVLVDRYGNIGIFQKKNNFDWTSYCFMWKSGTFAHFEASHENDKTYPATKEQRDILFKAMADAGYEFDFEKKELKKIEKHGN